MSAKAERAIEQTGRINCPNAAFDLKSFELLLGVLALLALCDFDST
ncbi:unnamed protein product [Acidithrix sp. C25]|nr:unnamed protein product [Acidithrix sp. C25]